MNRVQAARALRLGYAVAQTAVAPERTLTAYAPPSDEAQLAAIELSRSLRTPVAALSWALIGMVAL